MVVVECSWAIALVVSYLDGEWAVYRQLQVIGAQAVAMSVGVREETALQHLVLTGFDARHQVRRCECDLFDFGEVVVGIAVQGHLADWLQWEFLLWPNLGDVEWIEFDLLGLFFRHDLNLQCPRWEFTLCD